MERIKEVDAATVMFVDYRFEAFNFVCSGRHHLGFGSPKGPYLDQWVDVMDTLLHASIL